jgi:hypothetical protein
VCFFDEGVGYSSICNRIFHNAYYPKAETAPIRFVQVGSVSGADITLPSAVLRSSAIELMGTGIGSIPKERFVNAIGSLLNAAVFAGLKIATKTVPLLDVEQAWDSDDSTRHTVFITGA